jgi:hypothetical protein
MLKEIHNKVLIFREGEGHISFLLGRETTKITFEYLITGVVPENEIVTTL